MAFKDNFRIEKIYFQRVKDDALILERWKRDPRLYSDAEVATIAKNACDSILMLYKLVGECWNDNANRIEKVAAELDALKATSENYHDELNEKIDEVNNYLNNEIRNLDIRLTAAEEKLAELVPSNCVFLKMKIDPDVGYYPFLVNNGAEVVSFDELKELCETYSIVIDATDPSLFEEGHSLAGFVLLYENYEFDEYGERLFFTGSNYSINSEAKRFLRLARVEVSEYSDDIVFYDNVHSYPLEILTMDYATIPMVELAYDNKANIVFRFRQVGTNYRVQSYQEFNDIYNGMAGGTQSSQHNAPLSYLQIYVGSGVQNYKTLTQYQITTSTSGGIKKITCKYFDPDNTSTPPTIEWTFDPSSETETVTRTQ